MTAKACVAGALSICLLAPASAAADRAGTAPVDSPHLSRALHVAFSLPGTGWTQVRGAAAGTPALGSYALSVSCDVRVQVRATARHGQPVVRGRRVQVRPADRLGGNVLVSSRSGRHGRLRWWLGSRRGTDVAVAGVQPAPLSIARSGAPWILYEVSIKHVGSCVRAVATKESAIALAIARTMRLAAGPTEVSGPFSTA